MTVRIYLPTTSVRLARALSEGELGPAPLEGHAVTDRLRAALPDSDDDELEYVALVTAAQASLLLADADARPLRMVAVLEVREVTDGPDGPDGDDPSGVRLERPARTRWLAALHADLDDDAVRAAVASARLAYAEGDEERADALAQECLDHEVGWYAVQEADQLV